MAYTFEIIGILFLLVMIYLTYIEHKKSRLNKATFTAWLIFWLGGILLIIFHPYVNSIISEINIVRVLDLYMIMAFMFLFALLFYLFVIIKHVEKRVEEVVRRVAMKELILKSKSP
mgnify:CR=1 FL=1